MTANRRKWTLKDFEDNLKQLIGITYHKMVADIEIFVNNEKVWFIDPLFLTPGLKGFDLDEDRAEFISEDAIEITDIKTKNLRYCNCSVFNTTPNICLEARVQDNPECTSARTDGTPTANSRFNVM